MEITKTILLTNEIKKDIFNKFLKVYENTDKNVWKCMTFDYFFKKYTHIIFEISHKSNMIQYAFMLQYHKYNKKISVLIHDETNDSKKKMLKTLFNLLVTDGYYMNASGKVKHILINLRVPVVSDINKIVYIMNKNRVIQGFCKDEILFGNPVIKY